MALTIVDSDILIDAGRGEADAINCLLHLEKTSVLAISTVSEMELIVGCRNKAELKALEKFLSRYQILKITDEISDRAVELLKQYFLSHSLLIADGLIAGTALVHNEYLLRKSAGFSFYYRLEFAILSVTRTRRRTSHWM